MFTNLRHATTFSIILLLTSCGSLERPQSEAEGVFATSSITDAFFIYEDSPSLFSYMQYINEHGKIDSNSYNTLDMAHDMVVVALEFKIDPRILLSLVRKESAFKQDAVSPTGAVGLTQFTEIAIQEVHDQMGIRGGEYARKSTIEYWRDRIPPLYKWLSDGKEWTWPAKTSPISEVKNNLKNDGLMALIYGTVLLKTNLSYEKHKAGSDSDALKIRNLYRKALERYNGDPPVMTNYAKKIMLWASYINF